LKAKNVKTLYVLDSAYFVAEKLCKVLNIDIVYISLDDIDKIDSRYDNNAIWITQPLLCTSKKLIDSDINKIIAASKKHNAYLVFDECLALKTCNLIENGIEINDLTMFVESPFKAVCINGILKTSFLVTSTKTFAEIYSLSLAHIYSYYYANLNGLTHSIEFFTSAYYDKYYAYVNNAMRKNFNIIKQLVENRNDVTLEDTYESQYISLCIKLHTNVDYGKLCKDILINTHCNVIPN